jgi:uncharacterized membrane protein
VPHEFSANLAVLAGGRGSAGGGGHVMARQKQSAQADNRPVLGAVRAGVLLGDWTYQLVGDKRTVNIGVGVVVVVLALIAGFGGVRLGSYHQRSQEERTASARALATGCFPGAGDSGGHGDRRAAV